MPVIKQYVTWRIKSRLTGWLTAVRFWHLVEVRQLVESEHHGVGLRLDSGILAIIDCWLRQRWRQRLMRGPEVQVDGLWRTVAGAEAVAGLVGRISVDGIRTGIKESAVERVVGRRRVLAEVVIHLCARASPRNGSEPKYLTFAK